MTTAAESHLGGPRPVLSRSNHIPVGDYLRPDCEITSVRDDIKSVGVVYLCEIIKRRNATNPDGEHHDSTVKTTSLTEPPRHQYASRKA